MDVNGGPRMVSSSLNRHTPGPSRRRFGRCSSVVLAVATSLLVAATGDVDVTFGDRGLLIFNVGSFGSCSTDLIQQASGKLVLAGYGAQGGSDADFVLTRHNASGTRDATFGDRGLAGADFTG